MTGTTANIANVTLVEDPTRVPSGVLGLCPGKNLRIGVRDFERVLPSATSMEVDVLTVAAAVYACDLAFKRGEREKFTRDISLTLPVVNLHAFERVKEDLQYLLYVLSNDCWNISFTAAAGQPESLVQRPTTAGRCLLFSGGLDSLSAALELPDTFGFANVLLCSHQTANPITKASQDGLADHLRNHFGLDPNRLVIRTGGRSSSAWGFPSDKDREDTQRTRSFMFSTIAALAARRKGIGKIVTVAENGQMAIHLPLSAARIGAFSTHTAHPEFLHIVGKFFSDLLSYAIEFENPFVYKTKAEVVKRVVTEHPDWVPVSVSCWRGSRLGGGVNHCGQCVPCLVRRISLEANGLKLSEYEQDIFNRDVARLPADHDGKRNLVELLEFVHRFSSENEGAIEHSFPELINQHIDSGKVIAMYKRFAKEASQIIAQYPGVAKLLPASGSSGKSSGNKKARK